MIATFYLLLRIIGYLNNSLKIPVSKHQEKQSIIIRTLSQAFVMKQGIEDVDCVDLQTPLTSFQFVEINISQCLKFKPCGDTDNTDHIEKVSYFFKIKLLADEKSDIFNDTEILFVYEYDYISSKNNTGCKIGISFLFNLFKGKKQENMLAFNQLASDETDILYQPIKIFNHSIEMGITSEMHFMSFSRNIKVYMSSEEDFLESETRGGNIVSCRSRTIVYNESLELFIKKQKSYNDLKRISFLNSSFYVDQIRRETSVSIIFSEDTDRGSDSLIKKLKRYVGSVLQKDIYKEKNIKRNIELTFSFRDDEITSPSYKSLFSKIKIRVESKNLYEELTSLFLWDSPKKNSGIEDNRSFLKIFPLFIKLNLVFAALLILLFFSGFLSNKVLFSLKGSFIRKQRNFPKKKKSLKHAIKNEDLPDQETTSKFLEKFNNKNTKNYHAFRKKINKTIAAYMNSINEEARREAVEQSDIFETGITSSGEFEDFTAYILINWILGSEKSKPCNKKGMKYKLYLNELTEIRYITVLVDFIICQSYKLVNVSFNNKTYTDSMNFFFFICEGLYYHTIQESKDCITIKNLKRIFLEFFIETLATKNLGTISSNYVLYGPDNETISLNNVSTAVEFFKLLFKKTRLEPTPFYKKLKYLLKIQLKKRNRL